MSSFSSTSTPPLHLVCGKIASVKSTLAVRLAQAPRIARISEAQFDEITRRFTPPDAS